MNPNLAPGVTDKMLEDQLDSHDCHSSPEDGCDCQEMTDEDLADLANDELNCR